MRKKGTRGGRGVEGRGKGRGKTSAREAGARYPGSWRFNQGVPFVSNISDREEREREAERGRLGRKGGKKGEGARQTGARRTVRGGRLPDGRLMEPRADFIFRGSPSRSLDGHGRSVAPLLSSRQGAETRICPLRGCSPCHPRIYRMYGFLLELQAASLRTCVTVANHQKSRMF